MLGVNSLASSADHLCDLGESIGGVHRQACPAFALHLPRMAAHPLLRRGELIREDGHGSSELGDLSEATKVHLRM